MQQGEDSPFKCLNNKYIPLPFDMFILPGGIH